MREKFVQLIFKLLFWDFPKYEPEKQEIVLTGYAKELENAHNIFDTKSQNKQNTRKEQELKKSNSRMLKTIGQLTLERDFLQDCFRQLGEEPPKLPEYGQ